MTQNIFLISAVTLMMSCQSSQTGTSPATNADPAAEMATKKELATEPRIQAAKRLDQLDAQIESWGQMLGGGEEAQAERRAQAVQLRAEAKRLREQMGTLDDKGGTGGRNLSREVEDGLQRVEETMKRLGESARE